MVRLLLSLLIVVALARVVSAQDAGVVIAFRDAPIRDVIESIARSIGARVLIDDAVQGRVTIVLEDRVAPAEAREILHTALLVTGNALVPAPGDTWKVLRLEAAQGRAPWMPSASGSSSDRLVTTLVRLRATRAEDLLPALDVRDSGGLVLAYAPTNSLILAMTEARLRTVIELVRALDRASETRVRVLPVRYGVASEVESQIREALPSDRVIARPTYDLRTDERTNSLIAEGTPDVLDEIERILQTLDVPAIGRGALRVVRILNADAESLAQKLEALAGGDAIRDDYQVLADPATNSLVVRGSSEAFAELRTVIAELDRVPRQVEVDFMVLELTMDVDSVFDVDGLVPLAVPSSSSSTVGAVVIGSLDELTGAPATDGAVTARITGRPIAVPITVGGVPTTVFVPRGAAQITAERTDASVRSLMQPHLLAATGEEHRLFAGDQIPVATSGAETATGAFTTSVNVERRDVGIDVRFTPTVHSDRSVELALHLSVESVAPSSSVAAGDAITFRNFEMEGTVRLVDGAVAMIGSAPQVSRFEGESGVPFLSKIPILGWFFRGTTETVRRRQIVVAVEARPVPTPTELRAESIRRRLAFERHLARTGPVRLDAYRTRPFGLLVATRSTRAGAEALLPEIEPLAGEPVINGWDLAGEPRFDVYLLGFDDLTDLGSVSLELREKGFHPALQYVGPLGL